MLSYCLAAFQELMDHGLIPWDDVASNKFIKKVCRFSTINIWIKLMVFCRINSVSAWLMEFSCGKLFLL